MMVNGHILFDPGCVEDVRPQSHPEVIQSVVEPPVVLQPQQQQLLETIRDTSLEINPKQDPDADDMTELTSRTDDELVRDAFNHLNEPETIEDEDEQEDEIVWDPRSTCLSPYAIWCFTDILFILQGNDLPGPFSTYACNAFNSCKAIVEPNKAHLAEVACQKAAVH